MIAAYHHAEQRMIDGAMAGIVRLEVAARDGLDAAMTLAQLTSAVLPRFAQHLTRRRFCEVVGIHRTTLRRWEAAGVVRPTLIEVLNSPTHVFSQADVELGLRLKELISAGLGTISVQAAAKIARRDAGKSAPSATADRAKRTAGRARGKP